MLSVESHPRNGHDSAQGEQHEQAVQHLEKGLWPGLDR